MQIRPRRLCQRLSRFSHDLEACPRCLEPTLNSLASTRLRALVRQPVVWSLALAVPRLRLRDDRSPCLWCMRRRCSALSRICFRIPTSRSSTLWLSIADTSVYLQPWSFASVLPSAYRISPHTINTLIGKRISKSDFVEFWEGLKVEQTDKTKRQITNRMRIADHLGYFLCDPDPDSGPKSNFDSSYCTYCLTYWLMWEKF